MKLEYQAYDRNGQLVCNVLEAATVAEATDRLRQQNLLVSEIVPVGETTVGAGLRFRLPRGRIRKLRDVAMFTRQLHSLVHSGTQLAQGLAALERQIKDPQWQAVVADLRTRIEQGSSLTDALGAHPDHFDPIYRNMVAAGESSGKLTDLLGRMAKMTRKRIHMLSMIRGAMIYPILLACVATIVMGILMVFVVPRFRDLFETLKAPLPPTTAFLIACSEVTRHYWYAVLGGVVACVLGLRYYLRSPAGRRMVDRLVVRMPVFGPIVRSFATARIARLLGELIDSHLPIQDVLRLTGGTMSNGCYAELMARAQEAVAHGQEMSTVFRDGDLTSPAFYEVLRTGEQSGRTDVMLLELAEFLDEENEVTLKSLTSILEPMMLVLMAIMVGFVAVSIFLPLFDVTSLVSGGAG
ncbi:MAG: Type II secretion system protein F [Phycisphaerae bacterium]|nr:Type II secretion system protein F [Phycisphaerae bacterium]